MEYGVQYLSNKDFDRQNRRVFLAVYSGSEVSKTAQFSPLSAYLKGIGIKCTL